MKKRSVRRIAPPAFVLSAALIVTLLFFPQGGEPQTSLSPDAGQYLEITVLDVGQGDCILARLGGNTMLIDAGTNKRAAELAEDLKGMGVEKIDILIGTHAHEDHIGGMDSIIYAFPIGEFYMPFQEHTTKTYEDVLDAAIEKELPLGTLEAGDKIELGGAQVEILAPKQEKYRELNNSSIVCRIVYGGRAALLTGDAEELSEEEMLEGGLGLQADILKVAHHGSSTSSSEAFLSKVRPSVAIISCGEGNTYGHPNPGALERLLAVGAEIYRTDQSGAITVTIHENGDIGVVSER